MDANQRSEVNNQTNNGANEKWTPGSQGKTADNGQPLDHTHPSGRGTQQMGNQSLSDPGTQQSGAGPGLVDKKFQRSDAMGQYEVAGGPMQSQIEGGSGAVEGITDSHQVQMEQKSGAYGLLEQPVGHRRKDSGVDVNMQHDTRREAAVHERHHGTLVGEQQSNQMSSQMSSQMGNTQGGGMAGPTGSLPPHAPAGSMGSRQSGHYYATQGGGMAGPHTGSQAGQEAEAGNTQLGVSGSGSMANQNSDYGGVHQSNDVAGGLPRSPGNSGARNAQHSTDRGGSQTGTGAADIGPGKGQLESNDASGHYPRSPGYANRLAGDRNMDDDTGFKRK